MNEFINVGGLATFGGLSLAVGTIVQFTKSLISENCGKRFIRVYAFAVSLILSFVFINEGFNVESIIVTIMNAILLTVATTGGYEIITDPLAEKSKHTDEPIEP